MVRTWEINIEVIAWNRCKRLRFLPRKNDENYFSDHFRWTLSLEIFCSLFMKLTHDGDDLGESCCDGPLNIHKCPLLRPYLEPNH